MESVYLIFFNVFNGLMAVSKNKGLTSIAIISSILFGLPFIGTDIYENQRSLTFKK
ncbi:hypothetical protein HMPREF0557_02380 [Listeria innocua ATCC 33091]|uniref:Uncharacterized protein n=1 Tax=Listeria innocua ATCC 33091 TaxID=1002366 RepID=A0AB72Z6E4_LISIO|nr:hypothetical protein HMPREF0557_02380 [Listeria innocua ATCC 33091]